jgi:hypothetical protein
VQACISKAEQTRVVATDTAVMFKCGELFLKLKTTFAATASADMLMFFLCKLQIIFDCFSGT